MEGLALCGPAIKVAHSRKRATLARRITRIAVSAAVVLIALIGAGYGVVSKTLEEWSGKEVIVEVPAGQRMHLTLADGTKVWLNSGTKLEYPSVFYGRERRVKVSGEAMFDVEHDAKQPFVVETELCDIEVLGTEFNVNAYEGTGIIRTSLISGSVKVTDKNDPYNNVVLNPNQQLVYSSGEFAVAEIPAHETFQWRTGIMTFKSTPFADLLKDLEMYYGVALNIDSTSLPEKKFSGKIRINEGVEHALNVLQNSHEFEYTWNEARDTIIIK